MDFKDDFITVVDNDEFVLLERKFILLHEKKILCGDDNSGKTKMGL